MVDEHRLQRYPLACSGLISGPGETPRYVSAGPPPENKEELTKKPSDVLEHTSAKHSEPAPDATEPVDEHPAAPAAPANTMPDEPAKDSAKDAEE